MKYELSKPTLMGKKYWCFFSGIISKYIPVCHYKEKYKINVIVGYVDFYTIANLVLSPRRKWSWKLTFKDVWNMNL